jgi:hypothetical protein
MTEMAAARAQLAQMKLTGVGLCGPKVYVDRRNCHRVVCMKVLCLGWPRTGTASKIINSDTSNSD